MTTEEKLKDILEHPENHRHSFSELHTCCMVDGSLYLSLIDAHPTLGYNGGAKCDVWEGPCACGAWH